MSQAQTLRNTADSSPSTGPTTIVVGARQDLEYSCSTPAPGSAPDEEDEEDPPWKILMHKGATSCREGVNWFCEETTEFFEDFFFKWFGAMQFQHLICADDESGSDPAPIARANELSKTRKEQQINRQILRDERKGAETVMQFDGPVPLRLYVSGLTGPLADTTPDNLKNLFGRYGAIDYVEIERDPNTNKGKGFAIVQFKDAIQAREARAKLDGFEIPGTGKSIKVHDKPGMKQRMEERKKVNFQIQRKPAGKSKRVHGWAGPPPHVDTANDDYWQTEVAPADASYSMQNRPYFCFIQSAFVFIIWIFFHFKDGTEEAGLESLFPEETDMAIHDQCESLQAQVWRWWTYQYSHIGFMHVGTNCGMLLLFGCPLEALHGFTKLFLMFNLGVFGGACGFMVWDTHTRVVGMSGGCYAILGMHLGDSIMNIDERKAAKNKGKEDEWKKTAVDPYVRIALVMFYFIFDVVQAQISRGSSVSHSAHVGGAVAGFIAAVLIGKNPNVQDYECVLRVACFFCGIGLIVFCLAWGMQWPPMEIWDQVPWCWGKQISNSSIWGNNEYHCVRCGDTGDCIERWSTQTNIFDVDDAACQQIGGWSVTEP